MQWASSTIFFQAEDGIRDRDVTGVQTCALPISSDAPSSSGSRPMVGLRNGSEPSLSPEEIGRASCRERVEDGEGGGPQVEIITGERILIATAGSIVETGVIRQCPCAWPVQARGQ